MADSESFKERVEAALAKGMPIPDFPEVSPLKGLAMAQHEATANWQEAGFSRSESLYMVACMFAGTPGPPPPHG